VARSDQGSGHCCCSAVAGAQGPRLSELHAKAGCGILRVKQRAGRVSERRRRRCRAIRRLVGFASTRLASTPCCHGCACACPPGRAYTARTAAGRPRVARVSRAKAALRCARARSP
jgi:hypothetical protein